MKLPRRIPKEPKRSSRWRSQAELCQLLEYEEGRLVWRPRSRELFADLRSYRTWNARFAGKEAFTAHHSEGYRVGRIQGRTYFAHRVIWTMHCGEPDGEIDHINGDRADNRLANLRLVSRDENRRNVKRQANNKSGAVGVYARGEKWAASIQCDKRIHSLGTFDTFEQALAARRKAEAELGFHPNHGRS